MAKLIFHKLHVDFNEIDERRLFENADLSPIERWRKTFALMALSVKFRKEKGLLKQPQRKGLVLTKKGCEYFLCFEEFQ